MSIEAAALTLYRVTTDQGEELLALGREAADELAAGLICRPDVLTVTCEPLTWDSVAELDVIVDSYFNGVDLHSPVAELADEHDVDFDRENFDPTAVLGHLRRVSHEPALAA